MTSVAPHTSCPVTDSYSKSGTRIKLWGHAANICLSAYAALLFATFLLGKHTFAPSTTSRPLGRAEFYHWPQAYLFRFVTAIASVLVPLVISYTIQRERTQPLPATPWHSPSALRVELVGGSSPVAVCRAGV